MEYIRKFGLKLMVILMILALAVPTFANSIKIVTKGTYITPGAVVYRYLNQNILGSQNQQEVEGVYVSSETKILKVLSDNTTLGLVQVEIIMNEGELPIIVWVRIVDIK